MTQFHIRRHRSQTIAQKYIPIHSSPNCPGSIYGLTIFSTHSTALKFSSFALYHSPRSSPVLFSEFGRLWWDLICRDLGSLHFTNQSQTLPNPVLVYLSLVYPRANQKRQLYPKTLLSKIFLKSINFELYLYQFLFIQYNTTSSHHCHFFVAIPP